MEQQINEIKINGVDYVRKDSIPEQQIVTGDIKIVVLQRGWIFIGRFERIENNCKLYNAYNLRFWGTTKGLGELVDGPTSTTKLDKCETPVEFDWLTVLFTIPLNPEKWKLV